MGTFKGRNYPEIAFLWNGKEDSSIILTKGWGQDFFSGFLADQISLEENS